MTYIASLTMDQADSTTAATLNAVKAQIGMIPNLFATLAKSPTALHSLLGLNQTIAGGRLSASEREVIALATSQANSCQYCVSAHSLLGKNAGLNQEQLKTYLSGLPEVAGYEIKFFPAFVKNIRHP